MKTCTRCKSSKHESEFYRRAASNDGLQQICKACDAFSRSARYFKNHEEEREARREYQKTERGKRAHSVAVKSWIEKDPSRRKAHSKVNYAKRVGVLKPQPCFICGEMAEAHHPDYSAPLDVIWLCEQHHKEAHMVAANTERSMTAHIPF